MRTRVLCFLLFVVSHFSFSQSGYRLDFTIRGLHDTTVYLCHYYGESNRIKDTTRVDHQGAFSFEGKGALPQGVYFLALNKSKISNSDFVIGQTQKFAMETSTDDYIKNMKITGDEDNRLFFENMIFNMERHKEAAPYLKTIRDSSLREDQKKEARVAFGEISQKVFAHQREVIAVYPTTMTARIFKATQQIEIPEPPKKADGTIDSTFQLNYYRTHFFDNFDLADDALIRLSTPLYQEKLNEYLDKLFVPQADTLTGVIKKLAAKAKKNPETYWYLVSTCLFKYSNAEIMGLDEVFVHLYDTYFATGEMDYRIPLSSKNSIRDFSDKIRLSMLGKTAPNLIMQDVDLKPKSMYDIKTRYTIVYFFRTGCGHCREETPKLVEFYNRSKTKYNIEVYAVAQDTSLNDVRKFIKEFKTPWITVDGPRSYTKQPYSKLYYAETTPTIYILDDKKKIIAKKPPVDKIEGFLEHYEKLLKKKAAKGS